MIYYFVCSFCLLEDRDTESNEKFVSVYPARMVLAGWSVWRPLTWTEQHLSACRKPSCQRALEWCRGKLRE